MYENNLKYQEKKAETFKFLHELDKEPNFQVLIMLFGFLKQS